jgi:hypothetical protein
MSENPNVEGIDAEAGSDQSTVAEAIAGDQGKAREETAGTQSILEEDASSEKVSRGVQRRIDELTREKYEHARRADKLQSLLEEQLTNSRTPQSHETNVESEPNPKDFPGGRYDPDYQDAIANFRIKKELAKTIDLMNESIEQREQKKVFEQRRMELAKAEKDFSIAHADYVNAKETLLSDPLIANHTGIGEAIVSSDKPVDLIYYLGKHPDEAYAIAQMTPFAAARRLGVLEATILQNTVVQKPASSAPDPINPVSGRGNAGNTDPSKARTMEEYVKLRRAQQRT